MLVSKGVLEKARNILQKPHHKMFLTSDLTRSKISIVILDRLFP